MDWFKQAMAFPLYATVAWLIWVLIQEVGPVSAFSALLGLVVVGFAVWIYGCTRVAEDLDAGSTLVFSHAVTAGSVSSHRRKSSAKIKVRLRSFTARNLPARIAS